MKLSLKLKGNINEFKEKNHRIVDVLSDCIVNNYNTITNFSFFPIYSSKENKL